METIQDFLKDIKDRLTNPLISSFIIAWLVTNWRITLGVLLYDIKDLKADGYESYHQLVVWNSNWWHTLILPGCVSLFYTFAFPYIRAFIKLKHAEVISTNDTEILAATKEGKIPVNKYLELREQSLLTIKKFEDLIEAEADTLNENNKLKAEIVSLKSSLSKVTKAADDSYTFTTKLQQYANLDFLNGEWVQSKSLKNGGSKKRYNVYVKSITERNGDEFGVYASVVNPFTKQIVLRLRNDSKPIEPHQIWFMSLNEAENVLQIHNFTHGTNDVWVRSEQGASSSNSQ